MELRKADVVCVVYAVDDEDTLDSGNLKTFVLMGHDPAHGAVPRTAELCRAAPSPIQNNNKLR